MSGHKRDCKENRSQTRMVTRDEEAKIVALLQNAASGKRKYYYPDVADLVEVLVDTGMRLGEAIRLQYKDIDFEDNLINVRMKLADKRRRVPMTKRVVAILNRRQEINQQNPFNLTVNQVEKAWAWVRVQIGVKDAHLLILHSLRYTCASRLVNAGVPMDIANEWLLNSRYRGFTRLAPLTVQQLNKAVAQLEAYKD
jgi:integrase